MVSAIAMLEQARSMDQLEELGVALADRLRRGGGEGTSGLEKGIERGRREGIERERRKAIERDRALVRHQATLKFGRDTAARLAPIVVALSDPGRIAKVATAVIECETAEEFITRAREA